MEKLLEFIKGIKGIVVACAVLIVVVYLFVPQLLLLSAANPLPASIQSGFDELNSLGGTIRRSAAHAKAFRKKADLVDVQTEYENVSANFNTLIDTAVRGLKLNSVDQAFLQPELGKALGSATVLRGHLEAKLTKGDVLEELLEKSFAFLSGANKRWQLLLTEKAKLKDRSIDDLINMKWPAWDAIKPSVI